MKLNEQFEILDSEISYGNSRRYSEEELRLRKEIEKTLVQHKQVLKTIEAKDEVITGYSEDLNAVISKAEELCTSRNYGKLKSLVRKPCYYHFPKNEEKNEFEGLESDKQVIDRQANEIASLKKEIENKNSLISKLKCMLVKIWNYNEKIERSPRIQKFLKTNLKQFSDSEQEK